MKVPSWGAPDQRRARFSCMGVYVCVWVNGCWLLFSYSKKITSRLRSAVI